MDCLDIELLSNKNFYKFMAFIDFSNFHIFATTKIFSLRFSLSIGIRLCALYVLRTCGNVNLCFMYFFNELNAILILRKLNF